MISISKQTIFFWTTNRAPVCHLKTSTAACRSVGFSWLEFVGIDDPFENRSCAKSVRDTHQQRISTFSLFQVDPFIHQIRTSFVQTCTMCLGPVCWSSVKIISRYMCSVKVLACSRMLHRRRPNNSTSQDQSNYVIYCLRVSLFKQSCWTTCPFWRWVPQCGVRL
jgi:hypothetical protein